MKPITLRQLVAWNHLVLALHLLAMVAGAALASIYISYPPAEPLVDFAPNGLAVSEETKQVIHDCMHNMTVLSLVAKSRFPLGLSFSVLAVLTLLSGLSALFTFLLYKRLGGKENS
jgi:hypothetical protein